MTLKSAVMPYVAQLVSSGTVRKLKHAGAHLKRQLKGQPATISVFLNAADPYSHVLLNELPDLQKRFQVKWSLHMVQDVDSDMFPAPQLLAHYSQKDAQYLARLYQQTPLTMLTFTPQQWQQVALSCQYRWQQSQCFEDVRAALDTMINTTTPSESMAKMGSSPVKTLRENQALRSKLGHYNSAMLYFENEWYWGVDRLAHLEHRLNAMGVNAAPATIRFKKTRDLALTHRPVSSEEPLELYWSARSPYSYLALLRCHQLCQHYHIPLTVKPVMPMMMRNMPVPQNKKMAIFLDTKREAELLNIPYGKVADPLGPGVMRCYALLDFARAHQQYLPFLLSFAKNVNARGIRADTDKGMEKIVTEAGLSWQHARQHLSSRSFQHEVDANLAEMQRHGLWGVPCIKYKDSIVWGQDRLVKIEQAIIANNETNTDNLDYQF